MNKSVLIDHYRARGFDEAKTQAALTAVERFESQLENQVTLDTLSIKAMKSQIQGLIERNENDLEALLALARYVHLIGRLDLYIYFTSILGGVGVMDHIRSTLRVNVGDAIADEVFDGTSLPLGSDPTMQPKVTQTIVQRMGDRIDKATMCHVLADNHHEIPASAFSKERELFLQSASLDDYLRDYHRRQIAVLQQHATDKTVWFEQRITQAVVDYVAANQELLSAVKQGNSLFMTKIPYDPDTYLISHDPIERRYLACHCPLVREAIKDGTSVDPYWCYCSGGFEKFPFEVILNQKLEVIVLESVLGGSEHCRFEVRLPTGWEATARA